MSSNSGFVPLFESDAGAGFELLAPARPEGSADGFVPLFGVPDEPPEPPAPETPPVEEAAAAPSPATESTPEEPTSVEAAEPEPAVEDGELLQVREEGFEVGRRAGLEAGAEEIERRVKALDAALTEVAGLRRQLLERCVADVAGATLGIAKSLVRRELHVGVGDLDGLVREILDELHADDDIIVHIAPEDHRAMREGYPGLLAHVGRDASLRVETSPDLTPGGILVETTFGSVDATVERRFEAFASAVAAWAKDAVEASHD